MRAHDRAVRRASGRRGHRTFRGQLSWLIIERLALRSAGSERFGEASRTAWYPRIEVRGNPEGDTRNERTPRRRSRNQSRSETEWDWLRRVPGERWLVAALAALRRMRTYRL